MQPTRRLSIALALTVALLAPAATVWAATCEELIEDPTIGPSSVGHVEVTFKLGAPGVSVPEFATEVDNQTSKYVCLQVDVTADNRPGGPDRCGACQSGGSGGSCTSHANCPAGEACHGGTCVEPCNDSADCSQITSCSGGTFCVLDMEQRIEVAPNSSVTVVGSTPAGTIGFPNETDGCVGQNQCDASLGNEFCADVRMADARVIATSTDGVNWTAVWKQLCTVPDGRFIPECASEVTNANCCPAHPDCD